MSAPNWSSTAPRSAWYYTRDPANPDTYVRHYTTWMEIMRDARANLGLAPTPVAWNGEFTEAMARFLQARGAPASEVARALTPVRQSPGSIDHRLVGFAIWAARFPTIPLSQFFSNGRWMVNLSTSDPAESLGIILPQYLQQLSQGTGNPVVPNSSLGGTPTTTAPPPGGTPGGTPGGKPPGGSPAVVVTGDVKPPGTTIPPGPGGTGTTTTTPPPPSTTPPVEPPAPPAPPAPLPTASVVNSGQQLRLVLFVLGGIAVVFGALTLLMRSEQKRAIGSQGRLPARV